MCYENIHTLCEEMSLYSHPPASTRILYAFIAIAMYLGTNYSNFQFDITDLSERYDTPICLIQGDNDWITPTYLVDNYYSRVTAKKKEMVTISNTGHTPFLDNPEQFVEAVKTFLSECENK